MKNEAFKKFYNKLRREGILRAFLCGLVIGFSVLIISSLVCWFVGYKGILPSILLFVFAVAASTAVFYFLLFSPNTKKMAKRIDELGLEERIITMTELEGDDSFIAVKQREDALDAMSKVNASAMKLVVSVPVIIACAAVCLGAAGTVTVHALNMADVVPSGIELVRNTPDTFYNIAYGVEGKGVIFGVNNGEDNYIGADKAQTCDVKVKAGATSDAVIAVADEGYVFVGWSDGYGNPYRAGATINENKIITAVFQHVADYVEPEEEDNGDNGGSSSISYNNGSSWMHNFRSKAEMNDKEQVVELLKLAVKADGNTAVALAGGGSGSGGGASFGNVGGYSGPGSGGGGSNSPNSGGSDSEAPPDDNGNGGNGGGSGGGDGPGGWQDNSASKQVIDGKTYYGDVFDEAYKEAMAYLNSGEDIPDYIKKIIKDYFDTIAV